ncbi:histidine kinase [Luteimonas sp. Y-2-2-4F]|nr:sensor histidine kinase [Luteimonas sp. Y-2-2-4F]MCD9030652.1 histidine kinase [Luteimonas sp. Y-2-2-4F]
MPIRRTLAVLLVLLAAVAAWLGASARDPALWQVLSAEMAPDPAGTPGGGAGDPAGGLAWRALDQRALARWSGPYWLRWRLAPTAPGEGGDVALHLALRAAAQPYWDGRALAGNGTVGRTAAEERPGRIDAVRVLPAAPAAGVHELLVHASSHGRWLPLRSADAFVEAGPVEALYAGRYRPWLIAALAAGALAAAWLYFFIAQRGRPRSPDARLLLWLGAAGLALPLVEAWRPLLGYAYPLHGVRLLALLSLHLAAAVLLPAYLARRFAVAVPRRVRVAYLAALLLAAALLPGFDTRGAAVLLLSLLASAGVLLRVEGEGDERAPILAVLAVGALALPIAGGAFLDGPYFLLLAVLMGFLLLRHAVRLRELDRHNARLRAERARLSLQLLQRGIQPHWLMNTLTSLQELIEQAPPLASRLVELLAEQFDRLRDSSGRERVRLSDELALCRNHLRIAGLALGRPIHFEVEADDTALMLPPGVLHAQVENALTHAGAAACADRPFRLRVRREGDVHVLELRSARGTANRRGQGTGTRYIEASLAAARPRGGRFAQRADGADWYGRIELPCAS